MALRRFFRRSRWDAERGVEIAAHIEAETADNIARGMMPEEARSAARRKFGNATHVREEIFRINTLSALENFSRDVAYGLRSLRKTPGFTAVAVASLALGIGGNTAIFSLVETLLLRPLRVDKPHELVRLATGPTSYSFPYAMFEEVHERADTFAAVFAHSGGVYTYNILLDGREERIQAEHATGDYFAALGIVPLLGRAFTAEQDRPGALPVAVISFDYWESRFGRDPSVLGKTFTVGKTARTIIGVGPPRFTGMGVDRHTDMWLTFGTADSAPNIVARLKPGVTAKQAEARLNVLLAQMRSPATQEVVLLPAAQGFSNLRLRLRDPMMVMLTVVALVLLIACANIANLSLARATVRRREIAVRLAIGASRIRLVLQLLTESLLLGFAGAAAGLVVAYWAGTVLVGMVVESSPDSDIAYRLDLRLLAFTAGVAALTAILFSLGPALRATRVSLTPVLKNEPAAARGAMPIAKLLVISQVALSLTLLLGAVLFAATLRRLLNQDLGFRPDSVLVAGFTFGEGSKDAQLLTAYRDLLDHVRALPGVRSATLSQFGPRGNTFTEPVYPETAGSPVTRSHVQLIAANFFATMEMPLIVGRGLSARDDGFSVKAAVISESLARKLFPDEPPVGKRLGWTPESRGEMEIVGVVKDPRYNSNLREASPAFVYVPMLQPQTPLYGKPMDGASLHIRVQGDAQSFVEPLRRLFAETRVRPGNIRTQDSIIEVGVRQERMLAKIAGFFGGVGLLLAAVGLYGLMAYTVSQRTNEMEIRLALGARPGDVVRLVLRESTVLVLAGVAVGTGAALAAMTLIESFLFGVTRTDPAMIALAASMLILVGLLAAWLPAMRASRVSPMTALRHE